MLITDDTAQVLLDEWAAVPAADLNPDDSACPYSARTGGRAGVRGPARGTGEGLAGCVGLDCLRASAVSDLPSAPLLSGAMSECALAARAAR